MVWRAISRGLRAVIYRPAQIVRASAGGPPHDLFEHVVRVCHTLRAVPDIDARIDMITSEYAVSAIHSLSLQKSSLGKAFHLVHPEPLSLRDFLALLPAPLPLIPLETWLRCCARKLSVAKTPVCICFRCSLKASDAPT